MLQKTGMFLIIAGIIIGVGYGVYQFFASFASIPLLLRIAIAVFIAGLIVSLIALGFDRYKESKKEKF